MSQRGAVDNTPVQTNASTYPIIGMIGLLHLVAVVEKLQTQTIEEKGALCPPTPFPPVPRPQRASGPVGEAAPGESSTPPVAAQPAAGASTEGLDHGVGHFRSLSITRQRHLLAFHGITMGLDHGVGHPSDACLR